MTDFSKLSLDSADALFGALKDEVVSTSSRWFEENEAAISGYLRTLSDATMRTAEALAEGRIGAEQAAMILGDQKATLEQTFDFAQFMTLVLAQKLVDGVFSIVCWAVFKHTGINLFPELVQP